MPVETITHAKHDSASIPKARHRTVAPAGTKISFGDVLLVGLSLFTFKNVHHDFQEKIKRYFETDYCLLTNSGRSALTVILKGLQAATADARNELIVPGYTCFSVPSAVKQAGLKIRIADFHVNSFEYDLTKLEQSITPKTLAILLVYPFSLSADVDKIQGLAKRHKIFLIEDAAQSMGLKLNNRYAGTIGDVGFFSLSKGKAITSIRGGIIITKDKALAQRFEHIVDSIRRASVKANIKVFLEAVAISLMLRPSLFWIIGKLPFVTLGETVYDPSFTPAQMPRAAVVLAEKMLKRLHTINRDRANLAMNYITELQDKDTALFAMPHGSEPTESLFLRFPLLVSDDAKRNQLFEELQGYGVSRMYKEPLAVIRDKSLFAEDIHPESAVNAESIAKRLLTLPTHSYVTKVDQEVIIRRLKHEL